MLLPRLLLAALLAASSSAALAASGDATLNAFEVTSQTSGVPSAAVLHTTQWWCLDTTAKTGCAPYFLLTDGTNKASFTVNGLKVDGGTVSTNADGPIAAGAAPSKTHVGGGVYNNPRLTLTNGQSAALQLDSDGSLYTQIVDWGGVGLGAATAVGTEASGNVVTVNAHLTGGSSGTPNQPSTTVGTSSGAILAGSTATAFIKLCVPSTAANGIWVRWDGGTATAAPPAE